MAAIDTRHKTSAGTYLRFVLRFFGMIALFVIGAGAVIAQTTLPSFPVEQIGSTSFGTLIEPYQKAFHGELGLNAKIAIMLLAIGSAVVVLWLLVETGIALTQITGRKNARGTNAAVQVGLAIGLVVIVNGLSMMYPWRGDLTRDKQFTLPAEVQQKLRQLDPSKTTDIIVYRTSQDDSTSGSDALDEAANRKIVEKVNDLVEQFREFGPQFRVQQLSRNDEDFEDKLKTLSQDNDRLKEAIEAAPGNSIFFHANGRVERLGFNEFYLLDKEASRKKETVDGVDRTRTQNLVLLPQGIGGFVDRVESVGRPRPKIALATMHPFLSASKESLKIDQYTSTGLRKSLERNGFDVMDIVLKKNWFREAPIEPAAEISEEYEFDRIESVYLSKSDEAVGTEAAMSEITAARTAAGKLIAQADAENNDDTKLKLLQEAAGHLQEFTSGQIRSEAGVRAVYKALPQMLEELTQLNREAKAKLEELRPQYLKAMSNERLMENRRQTDVKAKLQRYVNQCDLLIVPRMTTVELASRNIIPPDFFQIDKDQTAVIREFLKAGKPVLFAFGPTNVAREAPPAPDADKNDVEALIARFGIQLGTQTIITTEEKEVMARQRNGGLGETANLPPLVLGSAETTVKPMNPIALALQTAARAGEKQFEIKRSGYRPIYLNPQVAEQLPYAAEIFSTVKESWNEDRPVPSRGYVPKYEPTKPNDPNAGTRLQEHHGPFPVGVAIEVPIPADWLEQKGTAQQAAILVGGFAPVPGMGLPFAAAELTFVNAPFNPLLWGDARDKPKLSRIVVLGHGGFFTGTSLNPGSEALLLDSVNWQLKREDRLPRDAEPGQRWSYPRVALNATQQNAWHWGTFLGMPALAVFFGLVVLQLRRLR